MTPFQTTRQCCAKLHANDTRSRLKHESDLDWTSLILTVVAFQFFVADIVAAPVAAGYAHFTDRFGPHSLPLLPVGDKVQLGAFLDSVDPVGSPTISVQVKQGGTTLTLDAIAPGHPLYEGEHLFYKFIDFDPGLTGAWEIIPTDSTGTGTSIFTNTIPQPEFLPFVENVKVQGAPLGAKVSWTLPNLAGFDADGVGVRIIEATSGHHVFQSDFLSLQTTSFDPPAGILQVGVDYVYWVNLLDIAGDVIENSSKIFTESFRYTIAGDFNTDGTVDAADYIAWRKGLGTTYTQDDYNAWRTHFGQTLDDGSIASAGVAHAGIPEPAAFALFLCAVVGLLFLRRGLQRPWCERRVCG